MPEKEVGMHIYAMERKDYIKCLVKMALDVSRTEVDPEQIARHFRISVETAREILHEIEEEIWTGEPVSLGS